MELSHYFRFLRRNLSILLVIGLIAAAVSAGVAASKTVRYQSTGSILLTLKDTRPLANAYDYDQFYTLQAAELYSTNIVTWLNSNLVNESIRKGANTLDGQIRGRKSGGTIELTGTAATAGQADALINTATQLITERTKTLAQGGNRATFEVGSSALGSKSVRPNPAKSAGVGFVAGLLLGLILALVREAGRRTVQGPEALGRGFAGVIPASVRRRPTLTGENLGPYLMLREELNLARGVVVVGELTKKHGITAVGLAVAIARAGRSVVVLDGHFVDRPIAAMAGVPDGPGLAEAIKGKSVLGRVKRSSDLKGLSVVPAGRDTTNIDDYLTADRLQKVVAAARKSADVVIVSTAATGRVRHRLLAWRRLSDVVVYAIQRDVTRLPDTAFIRREADSVEARAIFYR